MGAAGVLAGVDGLLVPGGFGMRGIEGKIEAIRFARTKGIPFFGICLGMQWRRSSSPGPSSAWMTRTAPSSAATTQNPVIALSGRAVGHPRARRHDEARFLSLRARPRHPRPRRLRRRLDQGAASPSLRIQQQVSQAVRGKRVHPHRSEPRRQPGGDHRGCRRAGSSLVPRGPISTGIPVEDRPRPTPCSATSSPPHCGSGKGRGWRSSCADLSRSLGVTNPRIPTR